MPGPLQARLIPWTSLLLGAAGSAAGSDVATQHLTIGVEPIDEIRLSGIQPNLTIDTADAGSDPVATEADGGGYAITTNGEQRKITASLGAELPTGLILSMRMAAPSRGDAHSTGWQPLGVAPAEMVTGLSRVAESGIGVRYRLEASVDAGVVTARTETVSVTLTDGR